MAATFVEIFKTLCLLDDVEPGKINAGYKKSNDLHSWAFVQIS